MHFISFQSSLESAASKNQWETYCLLVVCKTGGRVAIIHCPHWHVWHVSRVICQPSVSVHSSPAVCSHCSYQLRKNWKTFSFKLSFEASKNDLPFYSIRMKNPQKINHQTHQFKSNDVYSNKRTRRKVLKVAKGRAKVNWWQKSIDD